MKKGTPVIRTALLFALLLGSLTLVVWRQSYALEMQRELDGIRRERVFEEARRSALLRRVDELESRARVSEAAREWLGMRLPSGGEIVILPLRPPTAGLAASGGEGGGEGGEGGDSERRIERGGEG